VLLFCEQKWNVGYVLCDSSMVDTNCNWGNFKSAEQGRMWLQHDRERTLAGSDKLHGLQCWS